MSVRQWLAGVLQGTDGNTSVSNLVMFGGLTVVFPLALGLLVADVMGWAPWPKEPMDWLRDYSVVVILPYCFKMISFIVNKHLPNPYDEESDARG